MRRALDACAAVSLALGMFAGCKQRAPLVVPGPTTARPDPGVPILSDSVHAATDAGAKAGSAPESAPRPPGPIPPGVTPPGPVSARFVKAGDTVEGGRCRQVAIAGVKGALEAEIPELAPRDVRLPDGKVRREQRLAITRGDVLVAREVGTVTLRGDGEGVAFVYGIDGCALDEGVPVGATVVPSREGRELRWAKGAMSAHLDLDGRRSKELYVGRLEGTARVAEHVHARETEILAAVEGRGTFTIDGKEQRLVAPQIVVVPAGTKHAWTPDPGTKLVAVQAYAPPGPEQRFVALDAAERDAGAH